MSSFVDSMLSSLLFLSLGIILFFILTSLRVYLIWYVQPIIYRSDLELNDKRTNSKKFKGFVSKLLSSKALFKGTIRHLIKKKKRDFRIENDYRTASIRFSLSIIEGLRIFLRPYLICGFLFGLISLFFFTKINYKIQDTLGTIQGILYEIHTNPIIDFLIRYKGWILFVFAIAIILIPILYKTEKSSKSIRSSFATYLTFLSILTNVSFFGAKMGYEMNAQKTGLLELELKILAVHNQIFETELTQDLKRVIGKYIEDESQSLKKFLDELELEVATEIQKENSIDDDLRDDSILSMKYELGSILQSQLAENQSFRRAERSSSKAYEYSQFYKSYNTSADAHSQNSRRHYMEKPYLWTFNGGLRIRNEQLKVKNIEKTNRKISQLIELFVLEGMGLSIDEIVERFEMGESRLLKKVAKLFCSESLKRYLAKNNFFFKKRAAPPDIASGDIANEIIPDKKDFIAKKVKSLRAKQTSRNIEKYRLVQVQNKIESKKRDLENLFDNCFDDIIENYNVKNESNKIPSNQKELVKKEMLKNVLNVYTDGTLQGLLNSFDDRLVFLKKGIQDNWEGCMKVWGEFLPQNYKTGDDLGC